MTRRSYSGNAAPTTLAAGINGSDTTILIAASTGWPTGSSAPFLVVIDRGQATEEKVLIQSRSGTTLTVATSGRGYDSTSAATHSAGATIEHCLGAIDVDEANAHVNDTGRDDHTQYHNTTRHAAVSHLIGTHLPAPAAPANVGTTASAGSSTSAARADHVHVLDATVAGAGLGIAAGALAVNVDGTTIEVNADTVRLAASAAGAGLTGGGGSALAVNTDGTTIEVNADTVRVAASAAGAGLTGGGGSALAVNTDGSTLEVVSDQVRVRDAGITQAKMASGLRVPVVCTSGTRPTAVEGLVIYETDTDELLVYNGVNWRRPWNMPWGVVGHAQVTASQNTITTRVDLTGLSVTWTAVANRRYRTTFSGEINGTVANDLLIAYICNGANTELRRGAISVGGVTGGTGYNLMTLQFVTTPGAGSVTHKVRLERNAGSGSANLFASSTSPASITVEDIGPDGAAS